MADEPTVTVAEVDGRRLKLTNLDKLLYPATETTKGEVLHYYAAVAPRLLPQMAGRPVTRVRFPHGVGDLNFFEKNVPGGAPSWLTAHDIDGVRYPFVDSTAALTYFANLASLEFHTPQWRWENGERRAPDRLVLDLDPGAPAGLDECARVALVMKDLLDSLGWACVPVTSGSKGMQVYAALDGKRSSDEAREFARVVAEKLTELEPDLVTAKMTKSLRPGKVFIDWSQNVAAKTTITPWSLRGRNRPFVALPRTWDEISNAADSPGTLEQIDLDEVLDHRMHSEDPMNILKRG
ncbi:MULTISPECIES: non-homologous end-joining DNA ligase [Dermacoccus]|uniref:ATP-dependent DNA ligase n=1 Tax=Dermacoccus abyssi TaxID=322596 RepID=A0ABX5ZE30_9MICO|nr:MULTISPECIES: non-homologous end-joining DNA ligase [Dermacoccus]MBZ4497598.1 non-homologous end-joining DNA ligase [Dermacoccus sp. Tok2021]QEH94150.1 ATP-dependent DNA ligase [Dermacoccus abyssi]RYI22362.1 ATP-dependent DNA ligase [Dermacoccus sp. 147Ba]